MTCHSAESNGVASLKWLVVPRSTWPTMTTISITLAATTTVAAHSAARLRRGSRESIHARVAAYRTKDTENLNGLAQIGMPVSTRGSATMPTAATTASTAMAAVK